VVIGNPKTNYRECCISKDKNDIETKIEGNKILLTIK